ncbi:MAG: LysR family transcriptional regulator [Gammaproteobacteria bacterium]|nr:LysR family transcriptional regulator [Gammaproteobacteria bacterium]
MAINKILYYKQNRLKQLRAFCYTAQVGSISGAAKKLFLSQPSVSLQIQALERELDSKLFERNGPKLKLTTEGEILLGLSHHLVQEIDSLKETFQAHCGKLEVGELNIAAGESTILYILPDTMQRFARDYPKINLKLHNVTGRDGLAMVRADEVDFAVGSMLDIPGDISYHPVFTYYPTLITPLGHPLLKDDEARLEDICRYGLILPPRHLSTWRIVDLVFSQHNLSYKIALEAGGWEVIKKYVELGMGVSIVTDVCLNENDRLGKISLDRFFPKRSYGVVMRLGKSLSPQAKRFIDMLDPSFYLK